MLVTWSQYIQFSKISSYQLIFSYTTQVYTIPIVITLVTKAKMSEDLKDRIQHQMATLDRQLSFNISVAAVERFGKTNLKFFLIILFF